MIVFLLKSSACLAVFLMFYKLLLEKERMHTFKRYYLLGALVLALVIPLITFTEYVEVTPTPTTIAPVENISAETAMTVPENAAALELHKTGIDYWPMLLWTVYALGILLFALKFFFNLWKIARNVRNNPKLKIDTIINVLLRDAVVPHTFLNYIFLNRQKFKAHEIPKDVLIHETTHALQKHSWDILFVELLQIVFWFNPLIHFAKKPIKLNHEFLADQAVLDQGASAPHYQNTLLDFASSAHYKDNQPSMANAINYSSYSSIKKRFKVMKTETSKKSVLVRSLLIFPLFALLLYGFSTKVQIPKQHTNTSVLQESATNMELSRFNTFAEKYNAQPQEKRVIPAGDLQILENLYGKMTEEQKTDALPFPECPDPKSSNQEGATIKQVGEYNELAKTYNKMLASNGNIRIKKSDIDRLEYLYGIMTEDQRAEAEAFPDFPEPPEPPIPPSQPIQPIQPELNDEEYAEEVIDEIIANQDPHDNINSINLNTRPYPKREHSTAQIESFTARNEIEKRKIIEKEKQRIKLEQSLSLPPPAPMIATHVNTDDYSKELKKAIETYLAERRKYNDAFSLFTEEQKGSIKDLRIKYNQIMGLYHNYAALAHKEDKFMQPVPLRETRKAKTNNNTPPQPSTPPSPTAPKSPLELLKELKKDNVKIILDGKEIGYEEAEKLFEENTFSRVNVRKETGGRPVLEVSTD